MQNIVSISKCEGYDYEEVRAAITSCVESLGGFEKFISPGDRVLIKPNLLTRKKPEDAVTTHPVFVEALASLLIERGARAVIGDSPGGPFNAAMLNTVYKQTGMEAAAAKSGASLNRNFKQFTKENPRGAIMKRLTMSDMINDADKIICAAKLKTHGMMTYSGAVKNMFGLVPGVAKMEYHMNMPSYDDFADAMIDICLCAAPVLSFIDGVVGMEGNGPSAGTPVDTKIILASQSPYHLDAAACKLIGLGIDKVPVLRRLAARGMIKVDMSDIVYAGPDAQKISVPRFKLPKSHGTDYKNEANVPKPARKFISRHVQTRPVFDKKACTGCGICKDSCPAKIISLKDKCAAADYVKCIRCYCCQELCPQKCVTIKRPAISRLMRI